VEVVASLSQGRTAAAQCGLFTHKSVPVIFEPPCINKLHSRVRENLIHKRSRVEICTNVICAYFINISLLFCIFHYLCVHVLRLSIQ